MKERVVLVADKTTARIFTCSGKPPRLEPVSAVSNLEGRLKSSELGTDKAGRMADEGRPNKSAYQSRQSPKETSLLRFMREVTEHVKPLTRDGSSELILIAAPKIRGILRQHLEKIKTLSIIAEIDRDLSEQRPEEIAEYIDRQVM